MTTSYPPALPSVMHVIGGLDIGGAEKMLLSRCRAIPASTMTSNIVCLSGRSGQLTPEFESYGVREVLCGITPISTFVYRFHRILRQLRPDVVVSHVSLTSGLIMLVAVIARVPRRVALFHSDGDGKPAGPGRRAYRWAMRACIQIACTDVVGVTESTARFSGARATARLRMEIIPNAVDMTVFTPLDRAAARIHVGLADSNIVVAHVGRAAIEKNRRLLPHILAAMPPTTVLAIAGSSSTDDLELDPSDALASRIHNLGLLQDVRVLLSAADVVILPSIREGSPVVVLEALACGRAVVASDLPGIRSIATGLPDVHLVAPGSSGQHFADVVMRAIACGRTPDAIRATLEASSLNFDTTLERWISLCQQKR